MRRIFGRWALATAVVASGLVLSAPAALAGGTCHEATATDAAGVSVDLEGACFSPTVLRVAPGQTVRWSNRDDVPHTVTGLAVRWGSTNDLNLGDTVAYRFTRPGIYPYSCIYHPGMVGAVVVGGGEPAGSAFASGKESGVVPATPPAAAEPQAATASAATDGSATAWRIVALVAIALLLATGLALVSRRLSVRRALVDAAA